MYKYKTKNMYLAMLGTIEHNSEKDTYVLYTDDELKSYTVVYYDSNGKIYAKDIFSGTKYTIFEKLYDFYRYKGCNSISELYSITRFMDVPSDYIDEDELVKILNEVDPARSNNVNDVVLLMVSSLNKKASNILDESELEEFNERLLSLSNRYVSELIKGSDSNNIDLYNQSLKQRYLIELLNLDCELSDDEEFDISDSVSELEKIKLVLSN